MLQMQTSFVILIPFRHLPNVERKLYVKMFFFISGINIEIDIRWKMVCVTVKYVELKLGLIYLYEF